MVGVVAAGASVVAAAVEYAVGLVGEGGSDEASDEDFLSSSKRLESLCLRPGWVRAKVMDLMSAVFYDLKYALVMVCTYDRGTP